MSGKAVVKIGGVKIAGTAAIAWRITAGTAPYTTTVQFHRSDWGNLRARMGRPLKLEVTDSRGVTTTIEQVYILHELASDSPNRVTAVIADRRWKWSYKLVTRDYNIPRKTGNRTSFGNVPVETRVVVDQFDYLPYSIKDDGSRWTAREALEDALSVIEPGGEFTIESLPVSEGEGGQFTLQNVSLRDAGDAAIARLLGYIPGADIYVAPDGTVIVYDAADFASVAAHLASLPTPTWAGENSVMVDRAAIRPATVAVFYQREIEALLEFGDDYNNTSSEPDRNAPFFENVIPTVDLETKVTETDPETQAAEEKTVPPGTYVRFDRWLDAMDADRPDEGFPWTFQTLSEKWVKGLEAALGNTGADLDEEASINSRVKALQDNFRQTFRINPRYMRRIREIMDVRVALLDPVTGTRAPAAVWGQACFVASDKGSAVGKNVYRNVDNTAESRLNGVPIIQTYPSPARVHIIDPALGIFRIEWIHSPFDLSKAVIPSLLVNSAGEPKVLSRDLADQDTIAFGNGVKTEGAANGIFLAKTSHARVLLTVVPSGPNDDRQFHRIDVDAASARALFRSDVRITGGNGPTLEVFVPPGEITARFAWGLEDATARATLRTVFGLEGEVEPITELPGFVLANEGDDVQGQGGPGRHLTAHSRALAAELLAAFADSIHGSVATPATGAPMRIVGNMAGTTLRVSQAPSARVDIVHQFPGQQRPMSRFAYLPDATRQQVLGTLPFR